MKNLVKVTILLITVLSVTSVFASTPTEQLGTCLVTITNRPQTTKPAPWYLSLPLNQHCFPHQYLDLPYSRAQITSEFRHNKRYNTGCAM